ncbi:MAG: alcohol dehydrogenase catalytic domain-containing protein [Planctomycetota bacterium]|nr:alcohol dehydrogenase catalytic domain-containing protein [Planctomycetota bacterium]
MRAVTFHGVSKVSVEELPAPQLVDPTDVVVAVRVAAICGSDLHPYSGRETGLDPGTVMGHEFLGEVVEVGSAVARWAVGDRVVAPFTTSCGACWYCQRGLTARCELGQLFGWRQGGRGLHGGQAEFVRVPLADSTLVRAPAGAADEAALLAGDVLSTGFYCAQLGCIEPEHVVAVVGAGPVGVCATIAARRASERVFAFDLIPERRLLAARQGATSLDPTNPAALEQVRAATDGRGVDVVLECVGSERATALSYSLIRPGGTIAAAGVHCEPHFAFSPGDAYDKNLTYRAGRCPARAMMDVTMPLVATGEHDLGALFSHRMPFEEAARGYEMFAARETGCTKVLLVP